MSWKERYKDKLVTPEEAAAKVKSGDTVAFSAGREAQAVGFALAGRFDELQGVRIFVPSPGEDFGWYEGAFNESFKITVGFPTDLGQAALKGKQCDLNFQGLIPFADLGDWNAPDVLLTEVSAPDERGFCSFGSSVWNKRGQVQRAKLVIAEVNDRLIRTYGDNYVPVSELDYLVEHPSSGAVPGSATLTGRPHKEQEPHLVPVMEHVRSLVRDGDTIQIGVGRTTEPLVRLGLFKGKKDLGYHSEATPPGIITLIKDGVINGSRKTINPGKAVVSSIGGGTREEMDWVNMNPLFMLVDVNYLEDIRVIAAHDNMVTINNALAVDLTGQITAESLGDRLIASAGGQIAFVMGAQLSKGGRSITVLPSTARDGEVSRIMPRLPEGTVVTIQRNCADIVVTEHGIAHLRGRTVRQRVEALINIAHPKFRDELRAVARKLYWPD